MYRKSLHHKLRARKTRIVVGFSSKLEYQHCFQLLLLFSSSDLLGKEFIFKCPITHLLTFLSFNLPNIQGVPQGLSKLPKLHVSPSKIVLSNINVYLWMLP